MEIEDQEILDLLRDARDFSRNYLSEPRMRCMRYYHGESDIPVTESNRSKVIKSDVQEVVDLLMPPIMEVFSDSPRAVEFFYPVDQATPENILNAEGATNRVNDIFYNENNGKLIIHDMVKDSLLSRLSAVKVTTRIEEQRITVPLNISDKLQVEQYENSGYEIDYKNASASFIDEITRYDISVIPPEEIIVDRQATSHQDAILIGQDSLVRRIDLLNMGFDRDEIMSLPPHTLTDEQHQEKDVRTPGYDSGGGRKPSLLDSIQFADFCLRIGSTVYHIQVAGDTVLSKEEIESYACPYVIFSAIRVPHTVVGKAPAETLIALSDMGTTAIRQMFDNIYWSNMPLWTSIRGAVNPATTQKLNYNSIIEVKIPDAFRPLTIPFVADKVFPFLEWIDRQRESRTGAYKDAMGLNAQLMQNQTATAAQAGVAASARQIAMYAWIIAETALSPLFKLIYDLISEKESDIKVRTVVGVSDKPKDVRLVELNMILAEMKYIQQTYGPQNPFFTPEMYLKVLREMSSLLRPNLPPEHYFSSIEELRNFTPPEPPPDPKMMELQLKAQANQMELQRKQADIELEKARFEAEQRREDARLQAELAREERRLEGKLRLMQQELLVETRLEAAKMSMRDNPEGQGNVVRPE